MEETTPWQIKVAKEYPKLSGSHTADVAIIGGGLAGVMSAYLLAKAGKKVTLIEESTLGSGATMYTTAFITQEIDTDISELVRMFGTRETRLVWESHGAAIDLIESIVQEEKIDCDFERCDAFFFAQDSKQFEELKESYQAGKKLGFDIMLHEKYDLGFPHAGLMHIPRQAKFHPTKFLNAVAKRTQEMGAEIFEHSAATDIKENTVVTAHGTITAPAILIATYHPFTNPLPVKFKKGMYVCYMYEVELPRGKIPEGIYWNLDNPYHFFRIDPDNKNDRMILGGEDHRKELPMDPEKNYQALSDYLKSLIGGMDYKITRQWTGPILEPGDGLAMIGETSPGHYVATAFSGNGMTYSGITALIMRDIALGKKNPWIELYNPKRTPTLTQLWYKGKDYTERLLRGAGRNAIKYRK